MVGGWLTMAHLLCPIIVLYKGPSGGGWLHACTQWAGQYLSYHIVHVMQQNGYIVKPPIVDPPRKGHNVKDLSTRDTAWGPKKIVFQYTDNIREEDNLSTEDKTSEFILSQHVPYSEVPLCVTVFPTTIWFGKDESTWTQVIQSSIHPLDLSNRGYIPVGIISPQRLVIYLHHTVE